MGEFGRTLVHGRPLPESIHRQTAHKAVPGISTSMDSHTTLTAYMWPVHGESRTVLLCVIVAA